MNPQKNKIDCKQAAPVQGKKSTHVPAQKKGEWEIKPTLCDHKDATRGNLLEKKLIAGKPTYT